MPSHTEFPWGRVSPGIWQHLGERLRALVPLLYTRLPLSYALGIGVGFFLLPYVLWWLTSTSRAAIPPKASQSLELHQLLHALHVTVADPALGQPSPGAASPFTPKDVEMAVHFVIQPSVLPSGETTYRLVPVDTALQLRPAHVQTLTMRLTPTQPSAQKPGASMATAPEVWSPKDGDLLPSPRLKKRAKS
jgi:hypothetical protein